MKSLRIITLAAVSMLVASAVISCNSDEETYVYVPLTQQEKATQINAMQGTYAGLLYYGLTNYTGMTDSVAVNWSVQASDSTLSIQDFPMKVFSKYVSNADLRTALENDSTHTLTANLVLYRPYGTVGTLSYSSFVVVPTSSTDYAVTLPIAFGEDQKNVTFNFTGQYGNYYYSEGQYANDKMIFYLILQSISIEGGNNITTNSIIGFRGKKQ